MCVSHPPHNVSANKHTMIILYLTPKILKFAPTPHSINFLPEYSSVHYLLYIFLLQRMNMTGWSQTTYILGVLHV